MRLNEIPTGQQKQIQNRQQSKKIGHNLKIFLKSSCDSVGKTVNLKTR